jgi:hypothetical protein
MKTKQPKTIEIKLLIPYALIAMLTVAGAAFIAGWHMNQSHINEVKQQAVELVSDLKVKK